MDNKEQCYTQGDGEKWTDYEDLMNDLREHYNIGEEVEVWEADKKEYKHSDFIKFIDILEDIQAAAMDKCGEIAEEYLNDIKTVDAEAFEKYLLEWFNKNAKLNFYGVENEHKIVVVVE